jgi:formylglycine-generating enzyme required for sulfatase activity
MSIHLTPAMQPIVSGTFEQGDTHGRGHEEEKPVHKVMIKPFAIGALEVTFEEYKRFAIDKGRPVPHDQVWGRGRRPVINVSWKDARDYAAWLSNKTGKRYRLPTESEWEYAARSGGKEEVWAGTSDEKQLPTYAVYDQRGTSPVRAKKPNGLGLYDMSGNVYEWVEDCWHKNYKGAPTDGSAWLEAGEGDCGRRVVRGGSWEDRPEFVRTSTRYGFQAGYRLYSVGFRLAQDIEG